MTLSDILLNKQREVILYRDDIISEEEDPEWHKKHPLGPVQVMLRCKLCDEILFRDLKEFGWLHNDSFWMTKLSIHLEKHV